MMTPCSTANHSPAGRSAVTFVFRGDGCASTKGNRSEQAVWPFEKTAYSSLDPMVRTQQVLASGVALGVGESFNCRFVEFSGVLSAGEISHLTVNAKDLLRPSRMPLLRRRDHFPLSRNATSTSDALPPPGRIGRGEAFSIAVCTASSYSGTVLDRFSVILVTVPSSSISIRKMAS